MTTATSSHCDEVQSKLLRQRLRSLSSTICVSSTSFVCLLLEDTLPHAFTQEPGQQHPHVFLCAPAALPNLNGTPAMMFHTTPMASTDGRSLLRRIGLGACSHHLCKHSTQSQSTHRGTRQLGDASTTETTERALVEVPDHERMQCTSRTANPTLCITGNSLLRSPMRWLGRRRAS